MNATALATTPGDLGPVEIPSRLFGPIRVSPDAFITFPDGLPGFAGERRFILLPAAPEGLFWLQSVDEGRLAFLLVDPFLAFPGYSLDLPDLPGDGVPPLVLVVATLPRAESEECTANLQAPVLLDLGQRTGRQLILADGRHSPRHPFDLHARLAV
ncbi:MAG TPA: flagellar assembly protein FliW [Gemmatimonadales bacterium]|nr:flagellar assembly protein FliW [Gemmatimonadales bacterium]